MVVSGSGSNAVHLAGDGAEDLDMGRGGEGYEIPHWSGGDKRVVQHSLPTFTHFEGVERPDKSSFLPRPEVMPLFPLIIQNRVPFMSR